MMQQERQHLIAQEPRFKYDGALGHGYPAAQETRWRRPASLAPHCPKPRESKVGQVPLPGRCNEAKRAEPNSSRNVLGYEASFPREQPIHTAMIVLRPFGKQSRAWIRREIPLDTRLIFTQRPPSIAGSLDRIGYMISPSHTRRLHLGSHANLHSTYSSGQVPHLHNTFCREYLRAQACADSFQPQLTLDTIQPW